MQQCGQEPLLNVTGDLVNILGGVCELLELHRLTQRMYNESNLHVILEQNILDICHWVCPLFVCSSSHLSRLT